MQLYFEREYSMKSYVACNLNGCGRYGTPCA